MSDARRGLGHEKTSMPAIVPAPMGERLERLLLIVGLLALGSVALGPRRLPCRMAARPRLVAQALTGLRCAHPSIWLGRRANA
jgi:hypothetical protein